MRVAICINKLVSAGAERLVVDQIREFTRRGIAVDLITLAPEREGDSFMSLVDLPTHAKHLIVFRSLLDLSSWLTLIKFLRRTKPDVLFTHLWLANTIGRIAGIVADVRTISFEHNVYDGVKTKKQFLIDWILQICSYKIVAVSNAVEESLVTHGIARSHIVVVENGIDLSRYRSVDPSPIPKVAFTYLFVGRLLVQKGVDVLLNALAHTTDGQLWVVGSGVERTALEEQARSLGIVSRVKFLGIRKDVASLLKSADCFVLPSRHEGLPMVLIEAMASGCPCVVSDFASAREVIRDGLSGLIVPIENVDALATAMDRIATDRALALRLGTTAMQDVERFSIEKHVATLLSVLPNRS
ncbi:MAG: glycosyltransferase [Candidatus Pacebacteria bacterium]|nr:glycosyltransferase [Candidatus Paceibacterota bacterium]